MNSKIIAIALLAAAASTVACQAQIEAGSDAPVDGTFLAEDLTDGELDTLNMGGGCSNAQIRLLQGICRQSCSSGSYGIDHCWPGTLTAGANVFVDVDEGGICVCR